MMRPEAPKVRFFTNMSLRFGRGFELNNKTRSSLASQLMRYNNREGIYDRARGDREFG